ncbi:MAG TPA: NADH-quinone oxidoreductase subunit L [Coriobacteriia bacterium]|jgi:NADH-quinone oxidoreductase subunit L
MPLWLTAVLVPAMPAACFVVLTVLRRRLGERAGYVAIGALAVSLTACVALFARALGLAGADEPLVHVSMPWAVVGGRVLDFGVLIDGLSASVMLMIGIVATMVVVYAVGYMHGDERFAWFFAVISLFTASMFGLVSASNLLQIMVFWEVMGVCSYLLIGFWYERPEARSASIKAFLTTRVGDMGFLTGVILLFVRYHTLDLPALFRAAEEAPDRLFLTVACLLLFVGAVGKSAQFPLYFWLPHAMAGPTPVSGLLHSATMVAAGVFLVARTYPLFEAAHYALPFLAAAGLFTATFGALLALTETDIKRTLAYSTMSQLGYMMGALGVGGLVAAVFHLITHAFFKSLLFLGAGSVIHGSGTQDVREMGGLAKTMPRTAATFLVATCAIAGLPPLAGFFSKDAILVALWGGKEVGQPLALLLFVGGLLTAVLTAFYMFRLYFTVFLGEEKSHAHESPPIMTAPLVALSVLTLFAGAANLPWGHPVLAGLVAPKEHEEFVWWLMAMSIVAASGGVYVAWSQHKTRLGAVYGLERYVVYERGQGHYLERMYGFAFIKPVFALSEFLRNLDFDRLIAALVVDPVFRVSDALRGADIDAVYTSVFVNGTTKAAESLAAFDGGVVDRGFGIVGRAWLTLARSFERIDLRGVDRTVDGVGETVQRLGRELRRWQTGFVANYALLMLGLGALIFYLAYWFTRGQS